ncbi:MAG TPA: class I SAM-dependent methyltransferase [Chitinophagaceae bacterium]|nr:class I SAM-dependent methyltransferase [Chitinophagaceae bacterium]
MGTECILCNSMNTVISAQIDTRELASLYHERAGTDARRFFNAAVICLYVCNDCGLKFYWPQAIGDGKFYDELQQYSGYYLQEKPEFREAAKFISSADNVLEIGCGEGLFANSIQYNSYTGLEFSEDAIRKAKQQGLNVLNESLQQHASTHEAQYDVVCYFQVLEHVSHPGSFIRDSLKCLKQGGKLLIAVPSEDSFIKDVVNFYLNMPPHHASRWTDRTLTKIAELYNLELMQLYHEPLHAIHKQFYLKTKLNKQLSALVGKKYKAVDTGVFNKLIYGTATLSSFALKGLIDSKNIIGQSVLGVYKKKLIDIF